jgi:hypothetical protein
VESHPTVIVGKRHNFGAEFLALDRARKQSNRSSGITRVQTRDTGVRIREAASTSRNAGNYKTYKD